MDDRQIRRVNEVSLGNLEEEKFFSDPPFNQLSPEQKRVLIEKLQLVQISSSRSERHRGPLPHPELLEKYNHVIPNGAERIMKMTENQSGHRIEIEKVVISNQQRQSTAGQYFALLITAAGLILSAWFVESGHDSAGSALGVATIGSVAVAFITGRKKQASDLVEKTD